MIQPNHNIENQHYACSILKQYKTLQQQAIVIRTQ